MKTKNISNLLCISALIGIYNTSVADVNDKMKNTQENHRYCGDGLLTNVNDYNSFMRQLPQKSTENMLLWEKLFNHQIWSAREKKLIEKFENNYYLPYIFRSGESKNLCRILHNRYIENDEKEYDFYPASLKWNNRVS